MNSVERGLWRKAEEYREATKPQVFYMVELRTGKSVPSTVRIERHYTRPATGLWNRLRRRRWITDVEIVGIYGVDVRRFEITRSTNRPSTMTLSLAGQDALASFQKEWL